MMLTAIIIIAIAIVITSTVAYIQDQAIYNYVDKKLKEFDEANDSLFGFVSADTAEIIERLDALEAQNQLFNAGRPPGIYDEFGNTVFSAVNAPEEFEFGGFSTLDEALTSDLDGTIGDEG